MIFWLILALFNLFIFPAFADRSIDGYDYAQSDVQDYKGMPAPSVSDSGNARIYFDQTARKLKCSEDGASYANCVSGSGSVGVGTANLLSVYVSSSAVGPAQAVYLKSGNLGVGSVNPTQKIDVTGSINASGNIGIGTTMICTGKGCPAKDIDVFLVSGQSNAQGDAETTDAAANSPIPYAGTAFQYYGSTISQLLDPVGAATYGSAWPQFAITYHQQTGHRIAIVPSTKGGTSQWGGTGDAQGCWDDANYPSDCTLQRASVTALNAAMTAFTNAGYNPIFKGVLWSQGEADATYINASLETQGQYTSALQSMIAQYRTDEGANTPFYIFRTGTSSTDMTAGQQQYRTIRNAQEYVASLDPLTSIVFFGAVNFPAQGYMQVANSPHYTQAGYNIMGQIGAQNVLGPNQQNKAMYQQGPNMIFPTNIGIGSSTPLGLGTTIPSSQVSIRSPTPTGKMFTLINNLGTKLEDHTADGIAYYGGNVGVGDASPGSPLAVLGTFANVGVGTYIQMSSLMTVTGTGQRLFMGTFQATANTAAGITVSELDGQSTNSINAGHGTLNLGVGNNASIQLTGDGLINTAQPIKSQVSNSGTGTITLGQPFYGRCTNTGGGTFGTCVQMDLDTNLGSYTSLIGLRQLDTNAKNYFLGNVGIGSASPGQILDVSGTVRMTDAIDTGVTASSMVATDANQKFTPVTLTTTGSSGAATFSGGVLNIPQYTSGGGSSQFITGSVGIGTSSNVGVGTLNPNHALEVVGTANITGQLSLSTAGFSIGTSAVMIGTTGTGTSVVTNTSPTMSSPTVTGTLITPNLKGSSASSQLLFFTTSANSPTAAAAMVFENTSGTGLTNAFFIDNASNIGVGTASPQPGKFMVVGNIGIGTNANGDKFLTTSPPNGGMIIAKNVGIGTVTPGQLLDVFGNIRISNLGSSLTITQGSNACAGQSTLSSGTVTVSTTCTPSTSKGIFLTDAGGGVLANVGSLSVGTITGGTSFVINSSNALDSSAVNWEIHGI